MTPPGPMTPRDFCNAITLVVLTENMDLELRTLMMVNIMCYALASNGYGDGVNSFMRFAKWYA
jgi:hypothetical protein